MDSPVRIEDRILTAQQAIRRMKLRRTPFRVIETMIDKLDGLSDDQKAALWMYAWSQQSRRVLREETDALLTLVSGD